MTCPQHPSSIRLVSSSAKSCFTERNRGISMDLEYTAAEQAFRDDVRKFIEERLPAPLAAKVLGHKRLTREDFLSWHRILHTRGWSAPTWPKEFGGPGWNAVEQHIFD